MDNYLILKSWGNEMIMSMDEELANGSALKIQCH